MALGFYANGGVYVTPQNIIVLLAFFGPLTILGLYCRLGLKMPLTLFFRFVPLPFGLLLSAFFISVGLRYEHPFVLGGLIAALAGGCLATVGINLKIEAVRMFARLLGGGTRACAAHATGNRFVVCGERGVETFLVAN
jgi:hypothetical protein